MVRAPGPPGATSRSPQWGHRERWRPRGRHGPAGRRAAVRRDRLRTPGLRRRRCDGRTAPQPDGRRRVQLDLLDGLDQGDAHCARAAAQIDEDGSRPGDGGGSSDEELVRWRGTNTPGSTAIRRPQNSAQPRMCSSGRPTTRRSTHGREVARRPCCRDEQRCLVLGEHTADGLKPADDGEHDVVAGRAHAGHLDAIVGADVLAGVPCGDLGPAGEPASPVVHDGVLGEGGQERLGVLRVGGVDHLAYGGVELAAWALG